MRLRKPQIPDKLIGIESNGMMLAAEEINTCEKLVAAMMPDKEI